MTLQEIKNLITEGESSVLEFKTSLAHLKSAVTTLCAFLNCNGGTVLVGVSDKGKLVGQTISDATRQEIARELNKIEPPIQIQVTYLPLDSDAEKQIVVFHTAIGTHAPYVYDGRPYQREQSSTFRMPQQRYDQLVSQRVQLHYSWEQLPAKDYRVDDLDENLIFGVVRKAVEIERLPEIALRQSIPDILERLQLLENGHLTNAAVALFGKRFPADFLQCQLKVARFKGINRHEFLDSDLLTNNFFELLEAGLHFVRRHLPLSAKIIPGQLERFEKLLIPFDAIREALINALCHKDYGAYGGSVGLAIYDNRMEIFNDGGLLPTVTLDKIKAGYSKPRNPIMANVLYRCKVIERWGRGIEEIMTSCLKDEDPEPLFQTDAVQFKVVFPFPTSLRPEVISSQKHPLFAEFSPRQQEIIKILAEVDQLQMRQILEKLKNPPAERTLRDDLATLRQAGVIGSRGHARTAVWFLIKKI